MRKFLVVVVIVVSLLALLASTHAQNTTSLDEWTVSINANGDSCAARVEEVLSYRFAGTVLSAKRTIFNDQRSKIKNVAVSSDSVAVNIVSTSEDFSVYTVEWSWPNATSALTFVLSYSVENFVHFDDDNNTIEFTVTQTSNAPTSISDFSLELNLGWVVPEEKIHSVPAVGNFSEGLSETILEYRPANFTPSKLPWSFSVTFPAPTTGLLRECTSKILYLKNDYITVILIIAILALLAVIVGVLVFIGVMQAKAYVVKLMAARKTPSEIPLIESNTLLTSPDISSTFTGISASSSSSPQV